MKDYIDKRVTCLAHYIIENNATVRSCAKGFGISKSTVHKDVTVRLERSNKALFEEVRKVLDTNKTQRHIRGGNATKEKYERIKRTKSIIGEQL